MDSTLLSEALKWGLLIVPMITAFFLWRKSVNERKAIEGTLKRLFDLVTGERK